MWKLLALPALILLFTFCTSQPYQDETQPLEQKNPCAGLEFERIEVHSIKQAALHYRFKAENPQSRDLEIEIKGWNGLLNGVPFNEKSAALHPDSMAALERLRVESVSTLEKDLILYLDLNDDNEFQAELYIDLEYHYADQDPLPDMIAANAAFPWIKEPEFSITSIKILQADIVNTRAELCLRVKNPNVFPINLLFFRYELYGDGNFWTSGVEKNLPVVSANSSSEAIINFEMNFIGMKRRILDDIVAMRMVRYRVTGEVEVGTDLLWLPDFRMKLDKSGDSVVLK
jgi:LEA14-like dessication related protein